MITFCQKMSLQDLYDKNNPGYQGPKDIRNKRCSLSQLNEQYNYGNGPKKTTKSKKVYKKDYNGYYN